MATLELKIDRTAFLGALYKAQGVVDRKSTANVLSHVLLEAEGDGSITLTATDYDVILRAELPAEIIEPGTACINGKSLFDVVKNVDDSVVHLRTQPNHWAEVTAGRSHYTLAGVAAADFPEISTPADVRWMGIPRGIFKDLIDKTAFSVSDDETRMNLNGVYLVVEPGEEGQAKLTAVSTDGHRLSRVEISSEASGYEGSNHNAIVHKKGVQEIRRLLEDEVENVEVGFGPSVILFRGGATTFTVRQIEDTYPDYQRVIPPSSPVKISVDRQRMISAIKRIAILTSSKTYIIKMELSPGNVSFTTSNPDYGEGQDEFDIEYDGDGMVIGFNYIYLLDVLNALHSAEITLELSDEYGPSVITAPGEPGALFVVMPMRI